MTTIGQKYVDPDCMDYVMLQFAQHVQAVDESEIGEPSAYADAWIKAYIEGHPKFGVAPPAAPMSAVPVPMVPRQVQMPITNGPVGGRPQNAAASGAMAQRTFAPGHAHSMSDDEAKREMRRMGYTF